MFNSYLFTCKQTDISLFGGFFLVIFGVMTHFHRLLFSCGSFYIDVFLKSNFAGFM